MTEKQQRGAGSVKAAFGAKNRNRLINQYFESVATGSISVSDAETYTAAVVGPDDWFAHATKSDNQPGKNWYALALL